MAQDWLAECPNQNDSRCATLTIIRVLFGSFSFVLSLFMIFVIWLFKKYMFFSQRLILYLSIAALCDSVPYMMGSIENAAGCKFQGFMMTYFDWTCVGWVSVISANMYRLVKEEMSYESSESLFHLACWFLPGIVAGVPFIWDAYGHSGPWCWIKGENKLEQILRFLVWYGPVLVIVIFLTGLMIYLRVHTKRQNRSYAGYNPEEESAKSRKWREVRILFMYPIVFIAISVFPLITRIQMALNEQSSFPLVLMTSITAPLLGAVNTFLYSCSADMRQQMRPSFIWEELKHRKRQTLAETYNFAEENSGTAGASRASDIVPYDQ
ncbi:hypothetical protein ACHWQZ_G013353 [Mnemiopsis leidyi]